MLSKSCLTFTGKPDIAAERGHDLLFACIHGSHDSCLPYTFIIIIISSLNRRELSFRIPNKTETVVLNLHSFVVVIVPHLISSFVIPSGIISHTKK